MTNKKTILTVDDTPENIALIRELLKEKYKIKIATNGRRALEISFTDSSIDLILLDIMMPEMDGYEVCKRLKSDDRTRDIPVIFLTAKTQIEEEQKGLELGAVDYITKPISPPILDARVANHLKIKEANDFLVYQNEILEQKVQARTEQLAAVQDVTMVAMGSLAETRDNETGNHIRRTQYYVKLLATELRKQNVFSDLLTLDNISLLFKSTPLHDIGKVGIPDHILLKPEKLTPQEFEIMKRHTLYGKNAILSAEKLLTTHDSFLKFAREIAYSHHERWDGKGYPEGLRESQIPVSARIMALADVYDALISKRVYKPPFSHTAAVDIIVKGRGTHFDPDVLDTFLTISDQFFSISKQYADGDG